MKITQFCLLLFHLIFVLSLELDPDITLLTSLDNNQYNITCVIGKTEVENSVVLHTPITFYEKVDTKSKYMPYTEDYENCDFENDCTNKYTNNDWEIQSDDRLLLIAGDIRFESLEQITTTKKNKHIIHIDKDEFYLSFSVRSEDDPQIQLCENELSTEKSFCYWITIHYDEDEDNTVLYGIRQCPNVKISTTVSNSGCSKPKNPNYNHQQVKINAIKTLDWFHLAVEKTTNKLILKDSLTNNKIIDLDLLKPSTTRIIYLSSRNIAHWKIHNNNYLKLKKFDSPIELKPAFSVSNCLSMLVYVCEECFLQIWVESEEKMVLEGNNLWQNIKLNSNTNEFKVFMRGIKNNEADIIAIDNIRHCNKDEIRVLQTSVSHYNQNLKRLQISCKTLKNPSMSASFSSNISNSIDVCNNPIYIGRDCDILCSTIFGTEKKFCNKNLISKSAKNEPKCVCAAGYTGDMCNELCNHRYGYDCRNKCGNCLNNINCLKSTGHCLDGCDPDYIQDDFCLIGKNQPQNVTYKYETGKIFLNWQPSNQNDIKYDIYVKNINENKYFNYSVTSTSFETSVSQCSKYNSQVCAKNQCTEKNITIPAPIPKLTRDKLELQCIEYNETYMINVTVPEITNDTHCNSNRYVTVCNKSITINTMEGNSEILSKINCTGYSWITAMLQGSFEETVIILEPKKEKKSLSSYDSYEICVILENVYENDKKYNIYCTSNNSSSNLGLILGLVFGSIAIIAILIGVVYYIRIHKKKKSTIFCNRFQSREREEDNKSSIPLRNHE